MKVNCLPAVGEHSTLKMYVDNAFSKSVDESSLLAIYLDKKIKLDEHGSILLNPTLT